jgi:farnesyl-diphosphate farnesyltransferase
MKYTVNNDLGELAKPENRTKAVACLNEMITDALECVPECMEYMTMLKTEEVFRFCAIPQVCSHISTGNMISI